MPFVAHRVFGYKPFKIDDSFGLKNIKNGYAYSVCNSVLCEKCKFLFLDIRFSEYELEKLYKNYRDEEYTQLRNSYEPGYFLRNESLKKGITYIDQIEKLLTPFLHFPISILDWGGDTGVNTPFNKQKNNNLDIFDISNKNCLQYGNSVNKEIAQSKNYDLIICSNVLEHVSYPSSILNDIYKTMDRCSILYIEVPFENIMSMDNIKLPESKKHWHEHINFFSETSLRVLVQNAGLSIIKLNILEGTAGGNSNQIFQLVCKKNIC